MRPVQVVQEDLICPLYVLQARNRVPPLQVSMEIDGHQLLMEVDTGAAYSLISDATFKEFWPDRRLEKSDVRLCTYSGEPIEVLGSLTVAVKYLKQESEEPFLVVKGAGPPPLGMNWMEHIRLDWPQINLVQLGSLQTVLRSHEAVFQGGLGALQGYQARILVDPDATPRFSKARSGLCLPGTG